MLRDLTLLQFRSHRRAQVAFDGRPLAIFGPNGAGKTNLLEAVSLLSPGRGLRRAQSDELMRRAEAVGWKLRATTDAHEIETSALPGEPRRVEIDGKSAPQIALAQILRVLWLIPAMDRLWIEGAEGRRRFLDRMVMSFVPRHAEVTLAYDKAMRERNRLLKDMVRDPTWYHALEVQMAEAAGAIRANRAEALIRIAHAQDGSATAFPAATLTLENEGPEDLAAALDANRPRDMAAGRTLEGPHRADLQAIYAEKDAPAAQCSTGEQKALLISLILANARALRGEDVVLLLDEVAAHLDSARRAALYDEICALDAQVLMTGTGAELFDSLGARGQYIEVTEGPEGSQTQETSP
ncbi:recombinase RecF [Thioclava dalianensis]|uniref:DNA replication and repair protein RecF n=1 Tax=Thioclava dalianensis TaxID=1185766 RepID=A0A074TN23_9RHOB|nr:DNA replication/repair protein RecF [Thioclava dalianensis]KEP70383.1 recombinase RecF [Thioclava dalianensis]SFN32071.1 DNA replication and repair protein RecF [Thioclava dalianensis]